MRKALYFDHPDDFCDFVKQQGAQTCPANGNLFEMHRVVHPARPGETALILFNFKSTLKDRLFGSSTSIDAEVSEPFINWAGNPDPAQIVESLHTKTLVECVELIPWSTDIATEAGRGPVFFQIKKPELVATLIGDSLQLANDRIQYGTIQSNTKSQAPETLIRIEKPSYFLVQQCLEEYRADITVFYPEAEDLFVRWGYEHPLREWWKRSERKRSGEWVFFTSGITYQHLAAVIWQDAYDLTDLRLDFNHREVYTQTPEAPPRFDVKLRLTPKAADETEPELWLLDEAGALQLENTLQLTDEESLRSWQIAVQKLEDHSRDWLFIREIRASSKHSRHHDFGGIAFARYRGINDLLLPIGYELQPPLRRDAYRNLFNLEAGFITVLVPQENDASFLILKISERAFDSLGSFIDYLVERDAAVLENLIDGSVFDFKHYLKAPKHPGLTSGEKFDDGNRRKSSSDLGSLQTFEGATATEEQRGSQLSLMDRLEDTSEELDESQLGEIEKEELRLERKLATEGQSIDLWCELLLCKNQIGRSADAVISALEALWLALETPKEAGLIESLRVLTKNCLDKDPKKIGPKDQEWQRRAAVFAIALQEPGDDQIDQWVSETSAFLQLHDGGLRIKERWLAWGKVLAKNKDIRRETKLREEIRDRITREGLHLEDTPPFVRTRIFMDRKVGADPNSSDSQTAAQTAVANLEAIWEVTKDIKSERIQTAANAVLARAFSNIGDIGRSQNLIAENSTSNDACARSWECMFQIEALRGVDPKRANAIEEELGQVLVGANADTVNAITEIRETYQQRADEDNLAAFLARENRSRTYPHGPRTQEGQLYTLGQQLETEITAGNETGAVGVMRVMMTIEDTKEYDDFVRLPQFVETLVAGLEKFKWGEKGSSLASIYDSFAQSAYGYISLTENQFYGSILRSNLALGYLVFENVEKATQQIKKAHDLVSDPSLQELDFIDAASALIRTVEQLPLDQRRGLLRSLVENFKTRFDKTNSPYLSNERLFAQIARLLDQMAEAASSKDQLSLQQFRSYQLQDEFLILQRIQSETFTGQI